MTQEQSEIHYSGTDESMSVPLSDNLLQNLSIKTNIYPNTLPVQI